MDLNTVKKLCSGLGEVEMFDVNERVFGNIELEISTPNKTRLYITSDRGEFTCFVKKKFVLVNIHDEREVKKYKKIVL